MPEGTGDGTLKPLPPFWPSLARAEGFLGDVGEFAADERRLSPRTVVVRWTFVVSALGGGGRPASSKRCSDGGEFCGALFAWAAMLPSDGKILARHRKHSPVPK